MKAYIHPPRFCTCTDFCSEFFLDEVRENYWKFLRVILFTDFFFQIFGIFLRGNFVSFLSLGNFFVERSFHIYMAKGFFLTDLEGVIFTLDTLYNNN